METIVITAIEPRRLQRTLLGEFIEQLKEIATSIPEEYRQEAVVDFDTERDSWAEYDYAVMDVYYPRPKTEEDVRREQIRLGNIAAERKGEEIVQLKKLAAKYPTEAVEAVYVA